MDLKTLLKKEKCSTSEIFYRFNKDSDKLSHKVNMFTKDFLMEHISKCDINLDIVKDYSLTSIIDNFTLRMSYEKKELEKINNFVSIIQNYQAGIKTNFIVNPTSTFYINGEDITVKADFIMKSSFGTFAINIVNSYPVLSKNARTLERMPYNNLELYFLTLLAQEYDKQEGTGAFLYLNSKNTNDFSGTIAKNFVTYPKYFSQDVNSKKMLEKKFNNQIDDIIKGNLQLDSCSDCKFRYYCMDSKRIQGKPLKSKAKSQKSRSLTNDQLRVVMFNKGVARVSAGPGSGKTMTIVERFADLVSSGEDPDKILMITFTNAAAQEMKDRLVKTLEDNYLPGSKDNLNIYTFNSLGQKIIEENFKNFGFSKKPELLNKVEKYDLIYKCLLAAVSNEKTLSRMLIEDGLDLRNAFFSTFNYKGPIVKLEDVFSQIKINNITHLNDFVILNDRKHWGFSADTCMCVFDAYNMYQDSLVTTNKLDYSDQLMYINRAYKEIQKSHYLLEKYSWQHIIVDEFQDTSLEQMELLTNMTKAIKNQFKSLMVVGDAAQSIYGFRGTTPKNMIDMDKYFPIIKDFKLVKNFRSSENIVNYTNKVEAANFQRLARTCTTSNEQGEPVTTHSPDSNTLEALLNHDLENYEYKDIAILARTKKELSMIGDILDMMKIPYEYGYNEPVFLHKFLSPTLSFAQSIENPKNSRGYMEILALTRQINPAMDFAQINLKVNFLKDQITQEFSEQVKNVKDKNNKLAVEKIKFNIFKKYIKGIEDKAFKDFIKSNMKKYKIFATFIEFMVKSIDYKNDDIIENQETVKTNAITLTTAHSSKGKEWDVVYVMYDKFKIPRKFVDIPETSDAEKLRNDEERRLFYVATTRPKKVLRIFGKYPPVL